jgi:hypothetical protein
VMAAVDALASVISADDPRIGAAPRRRPRRPGRGRAARPPAAPSVGAAPGRPGGRGLVHAARGRRAAR